MSDRKALIRLAATLPKGSDDRRTLLGLAQKQALLSLSDIEREMIDQVENAIDDVESDYDAYGSDTHTKPGRGFTFGSGTDAGVGGVAYTTLSHMAGSGGWPNNSKLSGPLLKAEEKSNDYALGQWMKDNAAFIQENGLTKDQINYNDLYEMDFGTEAESLDEYHNEAMADEQITFRVGAFYFDDENDKVGRGGHAMEVFARVDFDGHFLPRSIDTFSTDFTFSDMKDLEKKLKAALSAAVKSLA